MFPLDQITDVGAQKGEGSRLIICVITFEVTESILPSASETDGQIDNITMAIACSSHIQGGPKKQNPSFNFAITPVNVHQF